MREIDIKDAPLNILITIGDEVHLLAFEKEKLEALSALVKLGVKAVVPTGIQAGELYGFLQVERLSRAKSTNN